MWNKLFWKAVAERAAAAGAYAAMLAWGGGALPDVSLPWWTIPAAFGGGAVLSLLKSVAASHVGNDGPSLTSSERLAP